MVRGPHTANAARCTVAERGPRRHAGAASPDGNAVAAAVVLGLAIKVRPQLHPIVAKVLEDHTWPVEPSSPGAPAATREPSALMETLWPLKSPSASQPMSAPNCIKSCQCTRRPARGQRRRRREAPRPPRSARCIQLITSPCRRQQHLDLAQHYHTVAVHEGHPREALAILEGVAHKGLLRLEAALSHLIGLQRVRVL